MKRGILIIVLVILMSSFVSAGLFSGVWQDYFTGRQVSDIKCDETDGGINYDVAGHASGKDEVTGVFKTYSDSCGDNINLNDEGKSFGKYVVEKHCSSVGRDYPYVHTQWYLCPNGCKGGACVKEKTTTCTDSDGGKEYYVKGTMIDSTGFKRTDFCHEEGDLVLEDFCRDKECGSNVLEEFYCAEDTIGNIYLCPNGCRDGACVKEKTTTCTDSDGGPNVYVKGEAKGAFKGQEIMINSDWCYADGVSLFEYYCGDDGYVVQLRDPKDSSRAYICPNGCRDGACIMGEGRLVDALKAGECDMVGNKKVTFHGVENGGALIEVDGKRVTIPLGIGEQLVNDVRLKVQDLLDNPEVKNDMVWLQIITQESVNRCPLPIEVEEETEEERVGIPIGEPKVIEVLQPTEAYINCVLNILESKGYKGIIDSCKSSFDVKHKYLTCLLSQVEDVVGGEGKENFVIQSCGLCGNGACNVGLEDSKTCPEDCREETIKTVPISIEAEEPSVPRMIEGEEVPRVVKGEERPFIPGVCNGCLVDNRCLPYGMRIGTIVKEEIPYTKEEVYKITEEVKEKYAIPQKEIEEVAIEEIYLIEKEVMEKQQIPVEKTIMVVEDIYSIDKGIKEEYAIPEEKVIKVSEELYKVPRIIKEEYAIPEERTIMVSEEVYKLPREVKEEYAIPEEEFVKTFEEVSEVSKDVKELRGIPIEETVVIEKRETVRQPRYCDISGRFVPQKELKQSCENSYECRSNECSNGECISTAGLLQRILDILSKFFGGK